MSYKITTMRHYQYQGAGTEATKEEAVNYAQQSAAVTGRTYRVEDEQGNVVAKFEGRQNGTRRMSPTSSV